MGRQAVALNRFDAWAQHAVAHVLETEGRFEEGIEWLESLADTWENCNSMLYTHNWWHLALYYLKAGDAEKVLSLYDDRVWGRANKTSPKDQIGAIATLLRLDLQGVDTGSRWLELNPYLWSRLHEHALPFQDLHYVYALARAGETSLAAEMIQSMREHAQAVSIAQQQVWAEVAIPVAGGLLAYAKGDWQGTVQALEPQLANLQKLGGSHTQRALFHEIYTNAFYRMQKRQHLSVISGSVKGQSMGDRCHSKPGSFPSPNPRPASTKALKLGSNAKSRRTEVCRMILLNGGSLGC
jgi:tetratricopeptide (TPR) repeat protein